MYKVSFRSDNPPWKQENWASLPSSLSAALLQSSFASVLKLIYFPYFHLTSFVNKNCKKGSGIQTKVNRRSEYFSQSPKCRAQVLALHIKLAWMLNKSHGVFLQLRQCVDTYRNLFIFSVENMRNNKLKDIRTAWKHSR